MRHCRLALPAENHTFKWKPTVHQLQRRIDILEARVRKQQAQIDALLRRNEQLGQS